MIIILFIVDVVLEDRAGRVAGVEVKAAATLSGHDVRGLQALATATCKNWVRGVVLYAGAEVIPFSGNLPDVPLSRLWSELADEDSLDTVERILQTVPGEFRFCRHPLHNLGKRLT